MYFLSLFLKKITSIFIIGLLSLTILACESGNSNVGTVPTEDKGGVSLPRELKTTLLTEGVLAAYIIVDDGSRQKMSINGDNAGISLSGLTEGMHSFVIEFEYIVTANPGTPVMLARVIQELNVGTGSNTLSVDEADYDTNYDDDNDGQSNLSEIAAGGNPFAGYVISSISSNTTEDQDTASFTIVLTRVPTADVNIGVTSSDINEGVVNHAGITFTTADWNEPQTIIVTGVDDDVIDGNVNYSIIISAMESNDANYNGEKPADVSVTNIDNDSSGFNISPINRSTNESGATASFTARLNTQPTDDVVINLSSSNTGEGNIDKISLTFTTQNWQTPQTVTVIGEDDNVLDGNQSYTIDFSAAVSNDGNYNNLVASSVSVLNLDNEGALSVTLSASVSSINETGGKVTITATMSSASNQDVIVNLSYRGNASAADYTQVSSITIAGGAGATSGSVEISAKADTIHEGDTETFIVEISSVTNALEFGTQSAPVIIVDDDQLPIVSLFIDSSSTLAESVGSVKLTASIDTESSRDVLVNLKYTGTATANGDYTKIDSITIPAMTTFLQVDFNVIQDVIDEPTEFITIEVDSVVNGVEIIAQKIEFSIDDDDNPPEINFTTNQTVPETHGAVSIIASLTIISAFDITLPYTVGGTAGSSDHDLVNASINIPAGQTADAINFNILNDTLVETNETIVISMGSAANVTNGVASSHMVTITDNDFSIGGSISGINGLNLGLVLQNNGIDDYEVNAGGPFTFFSGLNDGSDYNVSIKSNPLDQICAVNNSSGTINSASVDNVVITCFFDNDVTVKPQYKSVMMDWFETVGATFNIYYSTDKGFDPKNYTNFSDSNVIRNVRAPYVVNGLNNDQIYYFVLEAVYSQASVFTVEKSSRPGEWVFDGAINDIAISSGGARYLGGDFTSVGINIGKAVPVDVITGMLISDNLPYVEGSVIEIISDGQSGWFVGGEFTSVGGEARNGLVHILSNGALDKNFPDIDKSGSVNALLIDNGTLYVAGEFSGIAGAVRSNLAAITLDGVLIDWSPQVDNGVNGANFSSGVYALAVSGDKLYIGGAFSNVNGITRQSLAAFYSQAAMSNLAGTMINEWGPWTDREVYSLAVGGNNLYIGGFFDSVNGERRGGLAAVGLADGFLTPWYPTRDYRDALFVLTLAVNGTTVYVGGFFDQLGVKPRRNLASIEFDGTINAWNPEPNSGVYDIKIVKDTVYVAGFFTALISTPNTNSKYLTAFGIDGGTRFWRPNVNGPVNVIALNGTEAYLGALINGFNAVDAITRNRLASINNDGTLSDWDPDASGNVNALAINHNTNTIYIGGLFSSIKNISRTSLAAVSTSSDSILDSWTANVDGAVKVIDIDDVSGTVYVGGSFKTVNGNASHKGIVALDSIGAIDSRLLLGFTSATNNGRVSAISVDNGVVYVGGYFDSVTDAGTGANVIRENLAAFTTVGELVTSWNPVANGNVNTLDTSKGVVYIGGDFTGMGASPVTVRNNLAAVTTAGSLTSWNPSVVQVANNTWKVVNDLAIDSTTDIIYVGGSFTGVGALTRNRLAAIDINGNVLPWDPDVDDSVVSLALDSTWRYIIAGGVFKTVGTQARGNYVTLGMDGVIK